MTHTVLFWKNLRTGYFVERMIARWLRRQGYSVWNIGGFKLPVDLLVWDDEDRTAWVQVKLRSNPSYPLIIKRSDIQWWSDCEKESGCPVILLVFTPSEKQFIHYDYSWEDLLSENKGKYIYFHIPRRPKGELHCEYCKGVI